jgi:hypothetical protein
MNVHARRVREVDFALFSSPLATVLTVEIIQMGKRMRGAARDTDTKTPYNRLNNYLDPMANRRRDRSHHCMQDSYIVDDTSL